MRVKSILAAAALSTLLALPVSALFAKDSAKAPTGAARVAADQESGAINTLTPQEKAEGWELLFDGKDLHGWHNFIPAQARKKANFKEPTSVRPGWEVKDGVLMCVDPHNAGDILTDQRFEWCEVPLD